MIDAASRVSFGNMSPRLMAATQGEHWVVQVTIPSERSVTYEVDMAMFKSALIGIVAAGLVTLIPANQAVAMHITNPALCAIENAMYPAYKCHIHNRLKWRHKAVGTRGQRSKKLP